MEVNKITADWMGGKYIGLTLEWDYTNREVHLSMLGYVQRALTQFHHEWTGKQQHQPSYRPPNYGRRIQYAPQTNKTPLLNKHQTKFIQEVTGTFLFYAWAIDCTMLRVPSSIATEQNSTNRDNIEKHKSIFRLCRNKQQSCLNLQTEQHGVSCPWQYFISKWTTSKKQGRRAFFHVQQHKVSIEQ